ncbi:UNVERIFIED_ORG: hypothetical protein B2H93_15965 [Clostridium botulinum]
MQKYIIIKTLNTNIINVTNSQDKFNNTVNNSHSAMDGLIGKVKSLVGVYLGFQAVKGITNTSDELVQTKARLDLMNYGLQTTEELQNMIFQSAQRSRGAYQVTADAVSKLGMQARSAFSSNEELVAFTEQLNKNFVVAGTSAVGVESVMLQLTQSMAAGKLQGEELNSVLDNAQPIVQHIADYMDVPVGKMKDLASEGKITADIIKKAMFASADETNAKFESMPKTIGQIWTSIKNNALMEFQPILLKINEIANNQGFTTLANNIAGGCSFIAVQLFNIINLVCSVAQFFSDNWGIIGPIIWGIVATFIAYNAVLLTHNIYLGISNALKAVAAINSALHGVAITAEMAATVGMTQAQLAFNVALLSCPITWIVIAIIALIAILYAVVGVINKVKGTSISATGIIAGAFFMLGASIWNVIAYTWNRFASLAEFLANVFNHPIYSVKRLFVNLASNVLDACIAMTSGIDGFATNLANGIVDGINVAIRAWNAFMNILPDSVKSFLHIGVGTEVGHTASITGTLQSAKDSLQNWLGDAPSDYIEIPKMEMKSLGGAAMAGYNWGDNLSNKFGNMFDNTQTEAGSPFDYQSLLDAAEGANQGAGDTAKNTGAMKDALEITDEDLKYLRDFAEMEAINKYTTAEIKVEMGGINNTVNSNMDLDGIGDYLAEVIEEQMNMAAEGVYD